MGFHQLWSWLAPNHWTHWEGNFLPHFYHKITSMESQVLSQAAFHFLELAGQICSSWCVIDHFKSWWPNCVLLKSSVNLTRNSSLFGRTSLVSSVDLVNLASKLPQMVTTPSSAPTLTQRVHYRWWELLSGVLSENRVPSIFSWTCIEGLLKSLP